MIGGCAWLRQAISRSVLANIAEQTDTPALVTYFEREKKILAVAYCYLVSAYAKLTLIAYSMSITLVGV